MEANEGEKSEGEKGMRKGEKGEREQKEGERERGGLLIRFECRVIMVVLCRPSSSHELQISNNNSSSHNQQHQKLQLDHMCPKSVFQHTLLKLKRILNY